MFLGFFNLHLFLNYVNQTEKGNLQQIYYQKKICINKSVSRKPKIRRMRFLIPKTNLLLTSVVSNSLLVTRFVIATLNEGTVKEKGFCEFKQFWLCLRNFNWSLFQKNVSKQVYCHNNLSFVKASNQIPISKEQN